MKVLFISALALVVTSEAFAQNRAPRQPGNGRVIDRPGYDDGRPGRGGDAPRDHRAPQPRDRETYRPTPQTRPAPQTRPGPGRVVVPQRNMPRYVPHATPRRIYRPAIRPTITWSYGFGYACSPYGELLLNGRYIHRFTFSSECMQALNDIRLYGDFCNRSDLYDQSGRLEAQFYYDYECREALGWYY